MSASGVGPETSEDIPVVTKPPVEQLSDHQKAIIAKKANLSFSDMDWEEIEVSRYDFASLFRTKSQARVALQIAKRLEVIVKSLDHTMDAFGKPRQIDGNQISTHLMTLAYLSRELSSDQGTTKLVKNILLLKRLRSAARHAQLRSIEDSHKNYSRHRWTALINTLASIFDAHGCKTTAAKWGRSSELRQRSLFVDFVQAVLETLPSDMNDHRKSVGALSKIVSGKLKLHRAVRNFLKTGRSEAIR